MFAIFVMTAISFAVAGAYTFGTMKLYVLALPALAIGVWCGFRLYGRLDDAAFRRIILLLLLVAGISLIVPTSWRWKQNSFNFAEPSISNIVDYGMVAAGQRTA